MGAGTQNAFGHTVASLCLRLRRLRKPQPSEGFANPAPMVSANSSHDAAYIQIT